MNTHLMMPAAYTENNIWAELQMNVKTLRRREIKKIEKII